MKIRAALVAITAGSLLLAGCSSPSESAPVSTPSAESTGPAAEETSTVEQWASLIAQQKATWEDWESSWDDAGCSGVAAGSESGATCRIQMMSAMYMAETTSIEYELATGPGKKGYIAEQPPAEIADLFESTVEAATAAKDAAATWDSAGCSLSADGECPTLSIDFGRAIDDLMSEFDAWSPYI